MLVPKILPHVLHDEETAADQEDLFWLLIICKYEGVVWILDEEIKGCANIVVLIVQIVAGNIGGEFSFRIRIALSCRYDVIGRNKVTEFGRTHLLNNFVYTLWTVESHVRS